MAAVSAPLMAATLVRHKSLSGDGAVRIGNKYLDKGLHTPSSFQYVIVTLETTGSK
jgi:hypothetical protein